MMSDKLKISSLTEKKYLFHLTELSKHKNILKALDLLNEKMLCNLNVALSDEPIKLMELINAEILPISQFFVEYSNSSIKNITDYIRQWEDDLNVTNFMKIAADDISLHDDEFIKQCKDSYSYDIDSQFVEDYGDVPQVLYLNFIIPDSIKEIILSLEYSICPSDVFDLKIFTDENINRTVIVYHAEYAILSFYSILAIFYLRKNAYV